MRRRVKAFTFLCLYFLGCLFCTFAETRYPTSSFRLAHSVNVSKSYYCEFWEPGTTRKMTARNFSEGGTFLFSTLAIYFNTTLHGISLDVSFTDLSNTSDPSLYVPYSMRILVPDSPAELVPVTDAENGHGAGSARLLNSATIQKYDTSSVWNTDEIADFEISINATGAASGTYQATLTFTLEGP
ncbi:MAG: hypothetical protein IJ863_01895 [Spirochaetales bacterium]|nr:hypothetical protein [Spirochaetales bacterium]